MAQSSEEWHAYEMARDDWEKALIDLEKSKVVERETRWKLNDKVRQLENSALEVKE